MFWPIGSPRVYATSQRQLPRERHITSNDGVNSEAPPAAVNGKRHETAPAYADADAAQPKPLGDNAEHDAPVTQGPNGSAPQASSTTNGAVQGTDAETDVDGEIIALRVARNGQLFATITRSTLTIWQTKVRQPREVGALKAISNLAFYSRPRSWPLCCARLLLSRRMGRTFPSSCAPTRPYSSCRQPLATSSPTRSPVIPPPASTDNTSIPTPMATRAARVSLAAGYMRQRIDLPVRAKAVAFRT